MANRPFKSVFTNSCSIYNAEACLDLGFVNRSGSIKISPIFPDMKDKRARKGVPMYDRENAIMCTLSLAELVWLKNSFDELVRGNIECKSFEHSYAEDIKVFTIGRNVLNLSSKDDDPMESRDKFGILIELFDRQDGKDSEPLNSMVFVFNNPSSLVIDDDITTDHMTFSEWIDGAIRICIQDTIHSINMIKDRDNGGGNTGSYRSRRGGDRDEFDDRGSDEDYDRGRDSRDRGRGYRSRDDRNDDRDSRSRSSRERGSRGPSARGSEETSSDQVPF